jgi:CRISPR/Cas system-associated exonuclease Cas4 (RecB family)
MDTTLSRPRVPSFYALEILRAVEGALPDLAAFQKRSASAAQTRLSWPAPADPHAAIDNAEYDLASLKLTLDGGAQKGAARYLMDVSESLKRSLRSRGRRWRPGWFAEDGLVVMDASLRDALEPHRLRARTYSPSALQNFAQCPYRFALQSIFGLRPREDAVALDQMDPLTRGEIFHAVQFELFRHLQWTGLTVDSEHLKAVFDAADSVVDRVAAAYKERLAPAIERVWITEIEDVRTDLRAWLREVAATGTDWIPRRFEFGFGLDHQRSGGHDPASSKEAAVILDGFRVRGSMDLVEEHRQTGALRVVDHKTGKMPDQQPVAVGGGEFLQPLLYALAGENLWNRPVESGSLYYCTQRGGYKRIDIRVTDNGRRYLGQVLSTIDDAIERVFLPAAPAKDACQRCDYTSVCGPYEADRSRRKSQEPLEALLQLRALP